MSNIIQPSLFGIGNSNRDFTLKDDWGKNKFNSSFPAALVCYMASLKLNLRYITMSKKGTIEHKYIAPSDFLGLNYNDKRLYFSFESDYAPYQKLVIGNLPRIDLVTMNNETNACLKGIEIKLTALPDETTYDLAEDKYGCEIVVRPDTIVYLALSIILAINENRPYLQKKLSSLKKLKDWEDENTVLNNLQTMIDILDKIVCDFNERQTPIMLQPIWKTIGKSQVLADNAFDVFVWSNFAAIQLFSTIAKSRATRITRHARSIVWVIKMLFDYAYNGKINHKATIDTLSYNTKNDKAFSTSGMITHGLMNSIELNKPRVEKSALKHIILGGGHKLLSPERRLDAVILSNPDLFE